jgi:hypothetical protein
MFYGIRAETQALTREASVADREAYLGLLPLVDFRRISEIEHAGVSREYFGGMGAALAGTTLHGDVAVVSLGEISNPDFCAEFCDMILRLRRCAGRCAWAGGTEYCIFPPTARGRNAGRIIARVVGREGRAGGHGMLAGNRLRGPIRLPTYEGLWRRSPGGTPGAGAAGREPVPLLEGTEAPVIARVASPETASSQRETGRAAKGGETRGRTNDE